MTTGEGWTGGSPEDDLLTRLYQQVTEAQSARFGPGYDLEAGLDRYRAWLREHAAEDQATLGAARVGRPMALRASPGAGAAAAAAAGPGEAAIAGWGSRRPGSIGSELPEAWADREAAVTALYSTHYRSLVRLAALLVRDTATAEEVVQDSFISLHAAWRRLHGSDHALAYLRQSVVNRSRSVLRHRVVAGQAAPKLAAGTPGAGQEPLALLERSAVVSAMRSLPPRQREAVVLRYYADLSEAQIASAMGISRGAVKVHTARAMKSLRAALDGAG